MTHPFRNYLSAVALAAAFCLAGTSHPARAALSIQNASAKQRLLLEKVYSHDLPIRFVTADKVPVELIGDREMNKIAEEDRDSDASQSGDAQSSAGDPRTDPSSTDPSAGDPSGDPSRNGAASDDDDDDLLGVYDSDTGTISLRNSMSDDDMVTTFAHEYGHYVWDTQLTRRGRRQYRRLYASQRTAHHLVDHYAATDVEEGFAESFMFYVERPARLMHRDPVSYQFIDQLNREPSSSGSVANRVRPASRHEDPDAPRHRRQG